MQQTAADRPTVVEDVAAHPPVLQHALRGAGAAQRPQADVRQCDIPAAAAATTTAISSSSSRTRTSSSGVGTGSEGVYFVLHVKQQPDVAVCSKVRSGI